MTTFGWDSSTSTASTSINMDYYYGHSIRDRYKKVMKVNPERPLAHLKLKEAEIKDQKDKPSGGMPAELILFDPKDLV